MIHILTFSTFKINWWVIFFFYKNNASSEKWRTGMKEDPKNFTFCKCLDIFFYCIGQILYLSLGSLIYGTYQIFSHGLYSARNIPSKFSLSSKSSLEKFLIFFKVSIYSLVLTLNWRAHYILNFYLNGGDTMFNAPAIWHIEFN